MAHPVDESIFITELSEAISEVFSMPTPSNGVDVDEPASKRNFAIELTANVEFNHIKFISV